MYKKTTNKNTHMRLSSTQNNVINRLKKYGINLAGSIFNADSGYDDGEKNYSQSL